MGKWRGAGTWGWRQAAAAALLCLIASWADAAERATPPNIIMVFVDDAGYQDFPHFRDDRPRTPNIDKLADEGLRFTQFYVNAPICSPSRVALTTGQYPARWGITSFIASRQENARRGMRQWLDSSAPTLARSLKKTGYATGHFGKWHMGGGRDVGEAPLITEYGFDESLTQFEGLGDRVFAYLDKYDGSKPEKMGLAVASEQLARGEVQWMDRNQVTKAFAARARQFIEKAEAAGKPFFINVWPDDVHTPLFPPKELQGDGGKRELYLGVLENMDRQLGELFDFVRSSPTLSKNTIILVASDNGFEPGAGSAGDLKGSKGSLYEGGIREPLVVWGPGVLDAKSKGTTNQKTVISSVDVMRSLLAIAGAEAPKAELDGEDLSRSLLGIEQQRRAGALFWMRPPDRPSFRGEAMPDLAVRDGRWKLLVEFDGSNPRLYNIKTDPYENANLARKRPGLVKELTDRALAWYASMPVTAKREAAEQSFTNPIYEGADPSAVLHEGQYVLCQADGNRGIAVHLSPDLTKLGPQQIVWEAPAEGPYSHEVWAPEIQRLDGRWYIYFAASDGENRNHRSYALESAGDDPLGPYKFHGPLYTGDDPQLRKDNRWSIDAMVLEHNSGRYLLWSGWEDDRDEQWLYIAKMKSPTEVAGPRVRLCDNDDYVWERVGEDSGERGLHEAPQAIERDGRHFVVYSCSSSWQPTYKLGLLELREGGDPMNSADWKKHREPAFAATADTYGVGHASLTMSPDGKEDWIVYHAKRDRDDGWRRAVFAQPFQWKDGRPDFGKPVMAGELLPLPSGTPKPERSRAKRSVARFESLNDWTYFGHHQMVEVRNGVLYLGVNPESPVNLYRSGEKLIATSGDWGDVSVETHVKVVEGNRDAGILFRITRPAIGYDAQEGYFAGIVPRTKRVILGATNGAGWREVADAPADVAVGREYLLQVRARGPRIEVLLDGKLLITAEDDEYRRGSAGLRVVDTEAAFSDFEVKPLPKRPMAGKKKQRRLNAAAA